MKNDKINKAATQHNISQKSQAIYQHTIKQPVSQIGPFVRKVGRNMDIARSKSIAHFAPHIAASATAQKTTQKKSFDIGPSKHPLTVKAEKKAQPPKVAQASTALPTSKAIKEQMIAEAFSQLSEGQQVEKEAMKHKFRLINIIIAIIIVIFIIIYFIIINLPAISVSVASAQAGISATYPSYRPDGYSLNGNIAYTDGQVTINFRANTGDKKFSINQIKSSWDSSALRDQVNKDSNGVFTTTTESGLTIYTYGSTTTWVNGGILYTITGNAPLSNIQIRHIATSL